MSRRPPLASVVHSVRIPTGGSLLGSTPVGEWSNRSSMHGVAQDRMGLRSMRLVARGRRKPTSFWRAMAGGGGQLREQGVMRRSGSTCRALAQSVAERVMAHINDASDRLAVYLTGGSTQQGLYELMWCEPYRNAPCPGVASIGLLVEAIREAPSCRDKGSAP